MLARREQPRQLVIDAGEAVLGVAGVHPSGS